MPNLRSRDGWTWAEGMAGLAFCSKRCKLVDLGRWLGGHYHIDTPAKPEDLEACDELAHSPKPAVPSADPHREEA